MEMLLANGTKSRPWYKHKKQCVTTILYSTVSQFPFRHRHPKGTAADVGEGSAGDVHRTISGGSLAGVVFHFRNSIARKRSGSAFSDNIRRPGAGHPIPFSTELRQMWRHNRRLPVWLSKRLWKIPTASPAPYHSVKVRLWRLSSARSSCPPLARHPGNTDRVKLLFLESQEYYH